MRKKEENFDPCTAGAVIVIFGVTGDLARRKLMTALYENAKHNRLPKPFYIIGFARRPWSNEKMRDVLKQGVMDYSRTKPIDEKILSALLDNAYYVESTFQDSEGYNQLAQVLTQLGVNNTLFYLSTPPGWYATIVEKIGKSNLESCEKAWRRIVVEKPFGRDLETSQLLDAKLHAVFLEDQIYRMDHYLGKETVQNILAFRFGNGIFEPLWNRKYIDHIQITMAETEGVGTRAGYYDNAGAVRDVFQNHLLQLLSLTAMEAPAVFNDKTVRDEKVKVLKSIYDISGEKALENTFRAQYVSGTIDGKRVPSYRDEPDVAPESITETYMAARLSVNNWRWAGVPFYLRTGKRLSRRATEIAIQFTQIPLSLFGQRNLSIEAPNVLVIRIQPNEGITLFLGAKVPGNVMRVEPVEMRFNYADAFGGEPPEAYERLLLDCLMGDATLFTRSDEVEEAWRLTEHITDAWETQNLSNLPIYEAGTQGPHGANDFIKDDNRHWRVI
ncbi:MAG: glucose-6-phosphate dehydrogenase [Chloroflexota bacterium]|nr:glucose-6-phosphate dehydrogenase [Chloroflexota bacterium]